MTTQISPIRRYAIFLSAFWTAAVIWSFSWHFHQENDNILEITRAEARAAYEKDTLYRRWAARHGGVYVAVTGSSPPNPYLAHVPERDITTPSGKVLTLVNPAYLTRQVFELADRQSSLARGHITSLKPIRPGNAPDAWEAKALSSFERGVKEVSEVQVINGRKYMRLMRPFITEPGCLKCHASQGYRVGDVRGGVSASVPLAEQAGFAGKSIAVDVATHGVLWVLGMGMIGTGARALSRRARVLESSEERYRTVADYTAGWEYWQGADLTFWYVSPSCLEICGYSHHDFYRDPGLMDRIVHPDDLPVYLAHTHDSRRGKSEPLDFRIVRQDGEVRWIHHICRVVYSSSGKENGIRASNRDITDRKLAEATLKRQADLLENEVRERKDREAELEAKNAELERFAYTVSHDLKSPLITIKGFAGAVLQDVENGKHDRFDSDVRRIMGAADKMSALLNDLLELSRIGRLMNPPTLIDMNDLVHEVLGQLSGSIAKTQVEIVSPQGLPQVWGDYPRMAEVLQNLIENALKFMGRQAHPRIEIGVREDAAGEVFFVRDNGLGIAPQYLETVFGLFNKLDPHSDGTGIGLALARRIIEFHGGRSWVESEGRGSGSTFCFTVKLTQQTSIQQLEGGKP